MEQRHKVKRNSPLTPDWITSQARTIPIEEGQPIPKDRRTDDKDHISWWKRVVKHERIRHAQVEKVLTKHIELLERQNNDLRSLVFQGIVIKVSELGKQ